jgi:hypothetical protein
MDPNFNIGPKPLDIGSLIEMARSAQHLQGEGAIGDIYRNSIDPDTGEASGRDIIRNAFRAGPLAGQVAAQGQTLRQNQQALVEQQMKNQQLRNRIVAQAAYAHIADPKLSGDKLMDSIIGYIGHPAFEDSGLGLTGGVQLMQKLKKPNGSGEYLDPPDLREMVTQLYLSTLEPHEANEIVDYGTNPDGSPRRLPRAMAILDYSRKFGSNPDAVAPPHVGQAAPKRAAQAPLPQQLSPGLTVPNISGVPPGLEEAAKGIGTQSAASANKLTEANDTSMVRKGMLGNLENEIEGFTPGPGSDWTRVAKAFANRNIPMPASWQFDPKSIASQDAFNKQAAQLAQSQFATIGGTGTDAKFESAFKVSPNETLSKMSNQEIIRLLKGNEDAIQAKNRAWRNWLKAGHGPQTYADFSDDFNSHFDPRLFQLQYIPQKERQAYIDKMDPISRERMLGSPGNPRLNIPPTKGDLHYAHEQGWIKFDTPEQPKPPRPVP